LGQHLSTQRKKPIRPDDKDALTVDIKSLVAQYGHYGYRRITAMLRHGGWRLNPNRIWRRDRLKVPSKQPKRGQLLLNDGSYSRLRPEYPNHV
jgi:putative transposase